MSDDKCVSGTIGWQERKLGPGWECDRDGVRGGAGLTSASAPLLCCSSEVQGSGFQGECLWGEEGVPGAGTSGSGSSTGPGCTAGRISASAAHRRQTRGPSHSLERAPVTEELVTRQPKGCSWSGDPTSQGNKGRRRPANTGLTFVSHSTNTHCCGQQSQSLATPTIPPAPIPEGSGPRLNLWVLQQRQDTAPLPARVPEGPQDALG